MVNRLNYPWVVRSSVVHQHGTAGLPSKEDPPQNAVAPLSGTQHDSGSVTMPAVVMVPVMMVPVMMMVVTVSRDPDRPAVVVAAAPMMMAPLDPANIVDHAGIGDRRLHRRRCDDRRTRIRRRQGCSGHRHRCGSQSSETTCASMYLRTRPRHVSPTRKRYAVDPVALMSDAFRCNSPRCQQRGVAMSLVCSRAIDAGFARLAACGRIESRLVPDVLPQ